MSNPRQDTQTFEGINELATRDPEQMERQPQDAAYSGAQTLESAGAPSPVALRFPVTRRP